MVRHGDRAGRCPGERLVAHDRRQCLVGRGVIRVPRVAQQATHPQPGQVGDAAMTEALQQFVKSAIAPYKYPRRIVYLDAMPRTETGKLQRFKLRQMS